MALVYRHRRLDNNEIFYVGISVSKRRVNSKQNRNIHWHNIINKAEWVSEIIIDNITNEDAEELEIFLISEYGRKKYGGKLCNITIGGLGLKGYKLNTKQKKAISDRMKGHIVTEETKQKISKSHLGKKLSKEHINKMKKSLTGYKHTKESNSKKYKVVLQFDKNDNFINEFESLTLASKLTNTQVGHISKVCKNKRYSAGGFKWKYKNE